MSDELREAAAAVVANTSIAASHPHLIGFWEPALDLARGYLAAHPPDEPITEEWLREIGFGSLGMNGQSRLLQTANDNCEPVEMYVAEEESAQWWVSLLQSNNNDHVLLTGRWYKTRRQLLKPIVSSVRSRSDNTHASADDVSMSYCNRAYRRKTSASSVSSVYSNGSTYSSTCFSRAACHGWLWRSSHKFLACLSRSTDRLGSIGLSPRCFLPQIRRTLCSRISPLQIPSIVTTALATRSRFHTRPQSQSGQS